MALTPAEKVSRTLGADERGRDALRVLHPHFNVITSDLERGCSSSSRWLFAVWYICSLLTLFSFPAFFWIGWIFFVTLLSPLLLFCYISFLELSVTALGFIIYTLSFPQFLYNTRLLCLQCETLQQYIFISSLSFLMLRLSYITSMYAINLRDIMTFFL